MRTVALFVAVLFLLASAHAFAAEVEKGARTPGFDLKDQFGKQWKLDDLAGKVTILVAADSKSGRAMGPWVDGLKAKYANKVCVLGLLDLHSVPGIGRGFAKARIKRETKDPMMLDFNGAISRTYKVTSKVPTVVVIDKGLVAREVVSAAHSQKLFQTITSAVDKALEAK